MKFNHRLRRWGWDVHPPYLDFSFFVLMIIVLLMDTKKAKGPQNGSLTIPKFGSVNNY